MKQIGKKKAFTIVELVIVIAIIAVLAAVLVPTFTTVVKKAKISNDTQLVKNLNTALVADAAVNGKHMIIYGSHDVFHLRKNRAETGYDHVSVTVIGERFAG